MSVQPARPVRVDASGQPVQQGTGGSAKPGYLVALADPPGSSDRTVHHDAVYRTVHHDAVYETVHHDAVEESYKVRLSVTLYMHRAAGRSSGEGSWSEYSHTYEFTVDDAWDQGHGGSVSVSASPAAGVSFSLGLYSGGYPQSICRAEDENAPKTNYGYARFARLDTYGVGGLAAALDAVEGRADGTSVQGTGTDRNGTGSSATVVATVYDHVAAAEAYDEEVLVSEAYDEQVVVEPAWDEVFPAYTHEIAYLGDYDQNLVDRGGRPFGPFASPPRGAPLRGEAVAYLASWTQRLKELSCQGASAPYQGSDAWFLLDALPSPPAGTPAPQGGGPWLCSADGLLGCRWPGGSGSSAGPASLDLFRLRTLDFQRRLRSSVVAPGMSARPRAWLVSDTSAPPGSGGPNTVYPATWDPPAPLLGLHFDAAGSQSAVDGAGGAWFQALGWDSTGGMVSPEMHALRSFLAYASPPQPVDLVMGDGSTGNGVQHGFTDGYDPAGGPGQAVDDPPQSLKAAHVSGLFSGKLSGADLCVGYGGPVWSSRLRVNGGAMGFYVTGYASRAPTADDEAAVLRSIAGCDDSYGDGGWWLSRYGDIGQPTDAVYKFVPVEDVAEGDLETNAVRVSRLGDYSGYYSRILSITDANARAFANKIDPENLEPDPLQWTGHWCGVSVSTFDGHVFPEYTSETAQRPATDLWAVDVVPEPNRSLPLYPWETLGPTANYAGGGSDGDDGYVEIPGADYGDHFRAAPAGALEGADPCYCKEAVDGLPDGTAVSESPLAYGVPKASPDSVSARPLFVASVELYQVYDAGLDTRTRKWVVVGFAPNGAFEWARDAGADVGALARGSPELAFGDGSPGGAWNFVKGSVLSACGLSVSSMSDLVDKGEVHGYTWQEGTTYAVYKSTDGGSTFSREGADVRTYHNRQPSESFVESARLSVHVEFPCAVYESGYCA